MGGKITLAQDLFVNADFLAQLQAVRNLDLDDPIQNSLIGMIGFEIVPFRLIGMS